MISEAQLRSTKSYQDRTLTGIDFRGWRVDDWDFSNQDLTGSSFESGIVVGSDFTDAIIRDVTFSADFSIGLLNTLEKEQLYSTASYKQQDLRGLTLGFFRDMSDWDLSSQDLSGTSFWDSNLAGVNLANAKLTDASFNGTNLEGADLSGADIRFIRAAELSEEQLYSTDSYITGDLSGVELGRVPSDWDLAGKTLVGAFMRISGEFDASNLAFSDLRLANIDLEPTAPNIIHPDGRMTRWEMGAGDSFRLVNHSAAPEIRIEEQVVLGDESVTQLIFDDNDWQSTLFFEADIPVQFGGTLQLSFEDDVDVTDQVGREIQILNFGAADVQGEWNIAGQQEWDVSSLYETGAITLLSTQLGDCSGDGLLTAADGECLTSVASRDALMEALGTSLGDLDLDGQVSFLDFLTLAEHFGEADSGYPAGDIDLNGETDFQDFLTLARNFGKSAAIASVPEPSTFGSMYLILVLAICSASTAMRHSRS